MTTIDIIVFIVGLIAGMFVMAFINAHQMKELYRHEDEMEETIEQLEKEMAVKQNIIESNNDTIGRLRKICKKKGYETDDSDN